LLFETSTKKVFCNKKNEVRDNRQKK